MGDELTVALTNAERLAHYRAQTHSEVLTSAQQRRVNKVARKALSPHAGITRASRLRKAWERKRRRELRADARVLIHGIRHRYIGDMRRGRRDRLVDRLIGR